MTKSWSMKGFPFLWWRIVISAATGDCCRWGKDAKNGGFSTHHQLAISTHWSEPLQCGYVSIYFLRWAIAIYRR